MYKVMLMVNGAMAPKGWAIVAVKTGAVIGTADSYSVALAICKCANAGIC
jgi:hypothetical protein